MCVQALSSTGHEPHQIPANQLEVAILDRTRSGRTFTRLPSEVLSTELGNQISPASDSTTVEDTPGESGGDVGLSDDPGESGTNSIS